MSIHSLPLPQVGCSGTAARRGDDPRTGRAGPGRSPGRSAATALDLKWNGGGWARSPTYSAPGVYGKG